MERLKNNSEWLSHEFLCTLESEHTTRTPVGKRGRPEVDFAQGSSRSKRRKTKTLRQSTDSAESLTFAAERKHRNAGNTDSAKLLGEMQKTPTRAFKIRKAWKTATTTPPIKQYNDDDALAFFLEADLTKHQYLIMRQGAKKLNADIYPSYKRILNAKKKCYLLSMEITEEYVEVKLQNLLDHTATRLLSVHEPVLSVLGENLTDLILLLK